MEFYQISDLERLTGIKAHTIRIWEKRYNIIEPLRTETNIRYYNDDHVTTLLNIVSLNKLGYKISKVSKLTPQQRIQLTKQNDKLTTLDYAQEIFVNELVSSMINFDENSFEKTFAASVTRFGLFETMLNVFYPFLHKTGMMWSYNEAMPVQEHFATSIVKRKLLASIDGITTAPKKKEVIILFLPPDEWHEIGLLMSYYLLKSNGYRVIYLGPNLPLSNLEVVTNKVDITHFFTFFVAYQNAEDVQKSVDYLTEKYKKVKLLISGNVKFLSQVKLKKSVELVSHPKDLLKKI